MAKHLVWLAVLGLVLANGPAAAQNSPSAQMGAGTSVTVTLAPQNKSNESGIATLTQTSKGLQVVLTMTTVPTDPQPAHIHKGTCSTLDPKPAYPLTNVTKGTDAQGNPKGVSTTLLTNVTLNDLTTGTYAINVHKSVDDIKTYVACGDIKRGNPGGTSQ